MSIIAFVFVAFVINSNQDDKSLELDDKDNSSQSNNNEQKLRVIDSVIYPIGVCIDEDIFETIICEGSFIPARNRKKLYFKKKNNEKILIKIAQGYRRSFKQNMYLAQFELNLQNNQKNEDTEIEIEIKMYGNSEIEIIAIDLLTYNKSTFIINYVYPSSEEVYKKTIKKEKNMRRRG